MGFDAISKPAAAASADLDPWSARPTTGTDGDLGLGPGGSTYRWSSVVGEWVQSWVWDLGGTFVLDCKMDGDLDPSAESPAWTETLSGGGTSSSDGTYVSIDTTGANTDNAYLLFNHGAAAGAHHLMVGYMSCTSITGTGASGYLFWGCRAGDINVNIDPGGIKTSNNITFTNTATVLETGDRYWTGTVATERWIETYIHRTSTPSGAEGIAYLYVDHVLAGVAPVKDFQALAQTYYILGDGITTCSALIKLRSCKFGRWA